MNRCQFGLIVAAAVFLAGSSIAAESTLAPSIFWASDPVGPDETVLLVGSDWGAPEAIVEMARLDDADVSAGAPRTSRKTAAPQINWVRVPVLQASDQSLKFVVPADWKPGVFACRVVSGSVRSEPVLLNEPDPWWIQGDEADACTAGGWLRVFGKSLAGDGHSTLELEPEQGPARVLPAAAADSFAARFELPGDLPLGAYTVRVHNGRGGAAAWRTAGKARVVPRPAPPTTVFSVLESYGPEATKQMRHSLAKYVQPIDRTAGILAALKKAKENGGGVVYFPAGRYTVKGPLVIPDHTVLKGEGMGLVTLWWGSGHFNLDGGGPQGRARADEPKPPDMLIFGSDYGLEDMSLYLPLEYQQGVVADNRLRMHRVRIRIDHAWLLEGRGEGTAVRMGRNFQLMDCDIFAKGSALKLGEYGLVAHNRILAMKVNTELGGSQNVIVDDNQFVSLDPTAYQNIAGWGRNIYYAHNRHESLYVHQADYSFTFDASTGGYFGGIADAKGTHVTLAADPTYPQWAPEKSYLWRRSAVCILDGRGAGQWRDVVANQGRNWEIDRPFDVTPDASSVATIVPFSGRVLIVGNRFEDAAWVNAGYGTSIDVVCAENTLLRTGILMNHGVHAEDWYEPSWYVQYFDNRVTEGHTGIESLSGGQRSERFSGTLTQWAIHRRQVLAADNSGSISIHGNIRDAIVEGCTLKNPLSSIKVDSAARGVVLRNNIFDAPDVDRSGARRYEGDGLPDAVVLPPLVVKP